MIKQMNENIICSTGVVYQTNYEQVVLAFKTNPELAGELALSILELIFTGKASSDSMIVQIALKNLEVLSEKNREKYERRVAANERKKEVITKTKEERMVNIADLYNQGFNQKQIAEKLNLSESTVSKDMTLIRTEYPQMLTRK